MLLLVVTYAPYESSEFVGRTSLQSRRVVAVVLVRLYRLLLLVEVRLRGVLHLLLLLSHLRSILLTFQGAILILKWLRDGSVALIVVVHIRRVVHRQLLVPRHLFRGGLVHKVARRRSLRDSRAVSLERPRPLETLLHLAYNPKILGRTVSVARLQFALPLFTRIRNWTHRRVWIHQIGSRLVVVGLSKHRLVCAVIYRIVHCRRLEFV